MNGGTKMFQLVSKFKPSGDQPQAIDSLVKGIEEGKKDQVLLGATGTGKTFTIANVIERTGKPTLVLAHNKTLAGQLYAEFKELCPENHVEYFIDEDGNKITNKYGYLKTSIEYNFKILNNHNEELYPEDDNSSFCDDYKFLNCLTRKYQR